MGGFGWDGSVVWVSWLGLELSGWCGGLVWSVEFVEYGVRGVGVERVEMVGVVGCGVDGVLGCGVCVFWVCGW